MQATSFEIELASAQVVFRLQETKIRSLHIGIANTSQVSVTVDCLQTCQSRGILDKQVCRLLIAADQIGFHQVESCKRYYEKNGTF